MSLSYGSVYAWTKFNDFIDVEDAEEELLRRNLDFVLGCPLTFSELYMF